MTEGCCSCWSRALLLWHFQKREWSAMPPGSRLWRRPGADGEDEIDADQDAFGHPLP